MADLQHTVVVPVGAFRLTALHTSMLQFKLVIIQAITSSLSTFLKDFNPQLISHLYTMVSHGTA